MRADQDVVQWHLSLEPNVHRIQNLLWQKSPTELWLVGEDDTEETRGSESLHLRARVRVDGKLRHIDGCKRLIIANDLADQYPISIQKRCTVHDLESVLPGAVMPS
jgi:hypothetical protein